MGQAQNILVTPVEGGWCVECSMTGQLMFLSGAKAEEKARSLAQCLASGGQDVRVVIHDLSKQVVATRRYFSDQAIALWQPLRPEDDAGPEPRQGSKPPDHFVATSGTSEEDETTMVDADATAGAEQSAVLFLTALIEPKISSRNPAVHSA
jgi:hypothetical protein